MGRAARILAIGAASGNMRRRASRPGWAGGSAAASWRARLVPCLPGKWRFDPEIQAGLGKRLPHRRDCIDPAEPAQVKWLMQTPLPESSSRAPGAGVGDCKTYSVAYNAAGVLNILEAMPMRALFFERTDDTLNHAVLLRAARRDEHLAQLAKGHNRRCHPCGPVRCGAQHPPAAALAVAFTPGSWQRPRRACCLLIEIGDRPKDRRVLAKAGRP